MFCYSVNVREYRVKPSNGRTLRASVRDTELSLCRGVRGGGPMDRYIKLPGVKPDGRDLGT